MQAKFIYSYTDQKQRCQLPLFCQWLNPLEHLDIIRTIRDKGQIYQTGFELVHPFICFKNPQGQILKILSVDQTWL